MKNRYWKFKRKDTGVWCVSDSVTGKRESLRTKDKIEAQRLCDALNQAAAQPTLNLAMAKAYLQFVDPVMAERTWTAVMEEYGSRGSESTCERRRRSVASKDFDRIRNKKLIETTSEDLSNVLKSAKSFNKAVLGHLQSLALQMGWIPQHILAPKFWGKKKAASGKRGITLAEHSAIIAREQNPERRLYCELLWETGASQSDAAIIAVERLDNITLKLVQTHAGDFMGTSSVPQVKMNVVAPAASTLLAHFTTTWGSKYPLSMSMGNVNGVPLRCSEVPAFRCMSSRFI